VLFDLSIGKLLVLAIIAVVIFGPDQLPKLAAQAGRALRELRRLADGARDDLREGLGPEFGDFDLADLHPRNFVRKHLLDGSEDGMAGPESPAAVAGTAPVLAPGESPPYDPEAT
jgi:sec-independent protein translocase protein TatB